MQHKILVAASTALLATAFAGQAQSAIKCKGPYQVIKGHGQLATPYCGDNYLAQIARAHYGWKVSSRAVRNNPNLKERICLHIGHDIRVADICAGLRQEDFDGGGGK